MQNWDGCHALNIVGNPIIDINANLTFLSSRWKAERWLTPQSDWPGCHLKLFSSDLAWTCWKMYWLPPSWFWHLVEILEIPLLHVLSNDACKFSTNLFTASAESHLKMLFYYMLKDDWPPIWLTRMSPKIFQFRFSLDVVKDDWPSLPGSDIWWKSWKFHFCMYSPVMHGNEP